MAKPEANSIVPSSDEVGQPTSSRKVILDASMMALPSVGYSAQITSQPLCKKYLYFVKNI